jgi:hypothetical protein
MKFWRFVLAAPDLTPGGGSPIPILTGTLGVLSGFAVCFSVWIRWGSEKAEQTIGGQIAEMALLLLVAALVTFSIEYIRNIIEHDAESSRSENWGRHFGTFVLMCFLEAFVIAAEGGVEHWTAIVPFAKATLPIAMYADPYQYEFPGLAWVVVVSSVVLWLAVGCFVAMALAQLVQVVADAASSQQPPSEPLGRMVISCGGRGALVGLLWAPLWAFVWLVGLRVLVFIETFFVDPKVSAHVLVDRWQAGGGRPVWEWYALPADILWAVPKIGIWIFNELTTHCLFLAKPPAEYFLAALIMITVVTASIALVAWIVHWEDMPPLFKWTAVVYLLVAFNNAVLRPILGPLFTVSSALLAVWAATVFCWSIPAIGLGLAVPLLRDPATRPPCWAVVSAIAGVFTVALAPLWGSGWPLILLIVCLLGVITFGQRLSLIEHWGLAAILVSIILIGGASIGNEIDSFAGFFGGALRLTQQLTLPLSQLPPRVEPEYQSVLAYVRQFAADKAPALVQCARTDEACLKDRLSKAVAHVQQSPTEEGREKGFETAALAAYVSCKLGPTYECDNKLREVIDQKYDVEYDVENGINALATLPRKGRPAFQVSLRPPCGGRELYSTECINELFQPAGNAGAIPPDGAQSAKSPRWAVILNVCQIFSFSFWVTMGLLASWARVASANEC